MNDPMIRCTNPRLRRIWRRIFGTEMLPVVSARPRRIPHRGPNGRAEIVNCYVLDEARCHPMQVARLAGYLSRQTNVSFQAAMDLIRDGVPIRADACELLEPAETAGLSKPAFSFAPMIATGWMGSIWFLNLINQIYTRLASNAYSDKIELAPPPSGQPR